MTTRSISSRSGEGLPLGSVLSNWGALVALWALPYLSLLAYLRVDAAESQALQWLLVGIGASGLASILLAAWRQSRDPRWRARRGLSRLSR